ncbi:phosphoribosyltransferase [Nitrososphaera viennensis]|nr:phosphoribosyltransferase family protein [Nitrososphaera viennensis]AIC14380.1 putative Purine phosphoribosyltransferase (GpT-2) [Nitrososphaera viennensis EN76]
MQPGNGPDGVEYCSWQEIQDLVHKIAAALHGKAIAKYDCILAIANGGIIPAKLLAEELGIRRIMLIPVHEKQIVEAEMPRLEAGKKYLVVDDIYDTGDIYQKVARATRGFDCTFVFCMSRYSQEFGAYGKLLNHKRWIVFPWEKTQA